MSELADLVERSLACIASELPEWMSRIATQLPGAVAVHAEGDAAFIIQLEKHRLRIDRSLGEAVVRIDLTRTGLNKLTSGEVSVVRALELGDLDMRGKIEHLVSTEAAFHTFLHAASRARGIADIAESWRPR